MWHRALTQDLDIHDFDEYIRSKYNNESRGAEAPQPQPQTANVAISVEDSIITPAGPSVKTMLATDALMSTHSISEVSHIAQAVKVKLDHRFVSLHEAFQKLDVKNTGSISKQEFLDVSTLMSVCLKHTERGIIASGILNIVINGVLW
jgi:hypothetical protein